MDLLERMLSNPACWPALLLVGFAVYTLAGKFWSKWIGHFPGFPRMEPSHLDRAQHRARRRRSLRPPG